MKYAVNTRGRAVRVSENDLDNLLQAGFVQITKKQFENKKLWLEHDKGFSNTSPAIKTYQQARQKKEERGTFKVTVV